MAATGFRLVARVSSASPKSIKPVLEKTFESGTIKESLGEFVVEARTEGESAKELNRMLLSALRRVEKRTRLRAEWTSDDGITYKFFDYVLKKTTKVGPSA